MASGANFVLPSATILNQQHQQTSLQTVAASIVSKKHRSISPTARLFGPAIFEASKLKVMFLGVDRKKHLPRTYTLTHSDVTANLTLAISQNININQMGWYNWLQRDEVVAEWIKLKGKMSFHVHCHISGGHFLLDFIAKLRYYIFSKELPVVLKAFVHGDIDLFKTNPELEKAMVWVYFHSNLPEFNRLECWGELWKATSGDLETHTDVGVSPDVRTSLQSTSCSLIKPERCSSNNCSCCFPQNSSIPWAHEFHSRHDNDVLFYRKLRHNDIGDRLDNSTM